jgi:hypothetical protein
VFSWGRGDNGRLGLGGNSNENKPVCISDFDGMNVSSVSCGAEHTAAIADGKLFCWGKNRHGELGMESYNIHAQENSPTPVHDLLDDTMCSLPPQLLSVLLLLFLLLLLLLLLLLMSVLLFLRTLPTFYFRNHCNLALTPVPFPSQNAGCMRCRAQCCSDAKWCVV